MDIEFAKLYSVSWMKYFPKEFVKCLSYLQYDGKVIKDREYECKYEILSYDMMVNVWDSVMKKTPIKDEYKNKAFIMPYGEWIKLKNLCDKMFNRYLTRNNIQI